MADDDNALLCPHCGHRLSRWQCPPQTCWEAEFQYVCFNDDCPYFVKGWQWMQEKFAVKSSYRHRYNPATGEIGPLPVWSYDALKSSIVPEDA